jgi:hypothetical protein
MLYAMHRYTVLYCILFSAVMLRLCFQSITCPSIGETPNFAFSERPARGPHRYLPSSQDKSCPLSCCIRRCAYIRACVLDSQRVDDKTSFVMGRPALVREAEVTSVPHHELATRVVGMTNIISRDWDANRFSKV